MKAVEILLLNPVNGGTPVPGDWNRYAASTVREVSELRDPLPFSQHVAIPIEGQSLHKLGIHDGDILICRKTTRYIEGMLGVWQTPHGRTAKYAYLNTDGSVTLHNQNGWEQSWNHDEVTLVAVAIRVERDLI